MTDVIPEQLIPVLSQTIDPLTQHDLLALNAVSDVKLEAGSLSLALTLAYPDEGIREALVQQLGESLLALTDVNSVDIDASWQAPTQITAAGKKPVPNVRNVIAVASGKGGVGKSTTTVNLALAMSALGARVGVLDADIYGPSQPQMLGVAEAKPEIREQKAMIPVMAHGIQTMSMGFMLSEKTPAIWRGPMATGALQQLIFQTDWEDLDYLFVDMPPGTGDIQLTLSQQVPVTGAVVVTTPQDIALLDAKKAIEMFRKVNVPILGVVENMAMHQCTHCGHTEHIFGEGGGERIARDYQTQLLGALPLALAIREDADGGKPTVIADPGSDISRIYKQVSQKAAAEIAVQQLVSSVPELMITDD